MPSEQHLSSVAITQVGSSSGHLLHSTDIPHPSGVRVESQDMLTPIALVYISCGRNTYAYVDSPTNTHLSVEVLKCEWFTCTVKRT